MPCIGKVDSRTCLHHSHIRNKLSLLSLYSRRRFLATTTITTTASTTTTTTTNSSSLGLNDSVQVQGFNIGDFSNDLATWPATLPEKMRDYWIERSSKECKHKDHGNLKHNWTVRRTNGFINSLSLSTRVHTRTQESFERSWLCYSTVSGRVYCFVYKLMSKKVSQFTSGFNDWKHSQGSSPFT